MNEAAEKIATRLSELWLKSRPIILERTAKLHSVCETLSRNPSDTQARESGREAAHKLSGVLGVFGLPNGSEIASKIELSLKSDEPLTKEDLSQLSTQIEDLDRLIASKDSA